MRQTLSELSPEGNPFRQLEANAKILMPRRSDAHQRRWVAEEGQALGALDIGKLAAYSFVSIAQSPRLFEHAVVPTGRWVFQTPNGVAPGQVGRVDIARHRLGRQHEHRTTATIMSPPLDNRNRYRAGMRLEVDSNQEGPQVARVQLVEAQDIATSGDRLGTYVCIQNNYRETSQRALDAGDFAELDSSVLSASHAIIPLVVDCSRVLAELAAGTESASWTRLPIAPAPTIL